MFQVGQAVFQPGRFLVAAIVSENQLPRHSVDGLRQVVECLRLRNVLYRPSYHLGSGLHEVFQRFHFIRG